jgi:hypothetical protein
MALGSANANQNNRRYSNTYYSGLRIRNYSDHNAINISFSNGLMNIGIAKEDEETHKFTNEIEAFITPKKAMVLLDQMQHFENNEDGVFGVVVGMSDIQTAIGFQLLNDNRYLRIAKVNREGRITDQRTFAFPKDADAGYTWSDFENMKFDRVFNDMIDYLMLKDAISDFARGMSGSYGYGTLYMNRYQEASYTTKLNAVLDKLGIPYSNNSNNSNRNTNNGYFNQSNNYSNNSTASQHRSYEEISSMIDDDDDED